LWSAKADQPKSESTTANPHDDESVQVRLARAHLKLAKLNLRSALEANKRIPHVYPTEYIEKLRLHVVIDEAELEQCLKREYKDPYQVSIRSAEASVKIAEADLRAAREVHRRMPTTANAIAVERAAAVAEIATLNFARTKQLQNADSVMTHLQWQIDQLRHEVFELRFGR
jgi:hypothetical protein